MIQRRGAVIAAIKEHLSSVELEVRYKTAADPIVGGLKAGRPWQGAKTMNDLYLKLFANVRNQGVSGFFTDEPMRRRDPIPLVPPAPPGPPQSGRAPGQKPQGPGTNRTFTLRLPELSSTPLSLTPRYAFQARSLAMPYGYRQRIDSTEKPHSRRQLRLIHRPKTESSYIGLRHKCPKKAHEVR
jgi:hypothetical protein